LLADGFVESGEVKFHERSSSFREKSRRREEVKSRLVRRKRERIAHFVR